MKKSGRAKNIFRIIAMAIIAPIIIIWVLCTLLYLPPLQRYATRKIENAVAANSDFRLTLGGVHLTFPCKLTINDFELSKEADLIAGGEKISLNISLLPLLRGEVEVNYLLLENIAMDTRDLINGTRIAGNVEYFRGVMRNIDLANEVADIRQLHLNGANIKIDLGEGEETPEDSTSTPTNWKIHLRKSNIENTNIAINLLQDSTSIAAGIDKFTTRDIDADIASNRYSIKDLQFKNSRVTYDHGTQPREAAPLEHIAIEKINIGGSDILYSSNALSAKIEKFTLNQPDGINIESGKLYLTGDSSRIDIKRMAIKSSNGSFIDATATLPLATTGTRNTIKANAAAHISKRDLRGFITSEQAASFATLPDSLLNTNITLHGTTEKAVIDTIDLAIPTIAALHAHGEFENINNKKRKAAIQFNGDIYNTAPFTGTAAKEGTPTTLSIKGNTKMSGTLYSADINIHGKGGGDILAIYDTGNDSYDAKIDFKQFDIESSVASVPIQSLTMRASLSGAGTDIFSPQTYYQLFATIDTLQSNNYLISDITMNAFQANKFSLISLNSIGHKSELSLVANSRIDSTRISNSTELKLNDFSFDKIGLSDKAVSGSIDLKIEAQTDMNETHSLSVRGNDIVINTPQKRFTPADVSIDLATAPDSSYITAINGDLIIKGTLASGYNYLLNQIEELQAMFLRTRYSERSMYYANDFERLLPATSLNVQCGKQNMLHNFMAMNKIDFNSIDIACSIDTIAGLRAKGAVYNLVTTDTKLDTIRIAAIQEDENIKYFAGVRSSAMTPEKEKQSFRAAVYGNLLRDTLNTKFAFTGNDHSSDTKISANTLLMPEGLNIHIEPQAKIIGEEFDINSDNYINIGKDEAVSANIRATDTYGSGMHLYTIEDSTAKHDISLGLFNINLKKLTGALPFTPDIAGTLNGDIHFRDEADGIIVSCDMMGDSIAYEGNYIGNEMAEFVYLPKKNESHILSLLLYHNDDEYLNIHGDYSNGNINGNATLTKLPLRVINTFTQGSNMNIDGYIYGELSLNGPLETPQSNGFVKFDSVYIDAPLLGTQMRLVDDKVNIDDSRIKFNDFSIYAKGNTPFKVNGDIDITRIANPVFDLRMQAKNYELINAPRQKGSMIYGKLFLDINSMITGPMQSLKMYGNATVLGNTNVTYVMPESSIATNNELDGLVEFVNFSDTTKTVTPEDTPDLGNIAMSMTLNIEEGAWINADFDASRDSYINLQGGGQLNMSYTSETGISLTGRYTLNSGEMKYQLPIIPLKTFAISPGSYVNWTGDPMNPTLNITALERVTASVSVDGGNNQPVAFDVGLVLSNSLDNMGLSFTMQAPENAAIQDELNSLDAETLNKYAVTMLITGAYVGSNGGLTVSNALTSFLDAKINDIAGDAMKSVSINVGITDIENKETGGSYTNYSFSFAKRFWNDRLTIVIGGEVNSGDNPDSGNSFINNVSLEWRLTPNGNRYLRLFYDKNYESILEGEITETGIGYVYKRKLNNLNELLYITRRNKRQPADNNKEQSR